ncbi:MAG TPA: bestrophin family ion channel [Myxococcota bacterium]|nr:bestrophin family ion channel [Myxococcota bacterium]
MLVRPSEPSWTGLLLIRGTGLRAMVAPLVGVVAVATALALLHEPLGLDAVTLTPLPFQLVGVALSIFLGFRNNACYDRWWEARRLWGQLINTTRSLARQILTVTRAPEAERAELRAWQAGTVREVIAFVYALKSVLRTEVQLEVLRPFLPPDAFARVIAQRSPPTAVCRHLGERLRDAEARGWLDPLQRAILEQSLVTLTDVQGACERIKNTPVPLSYTALTHRIVGLYCLGLPFGIFSTVGPLTPVVVAFVAFSFLGLDVVGTQLEDPFETDPNDLPLSAMARTIEIDLLQLLDEPSPPPVAPVGGVLL